MDEKYIFRKIVYRNDAFGEGTIKEVVVLGVNVGYDDLTSVVDLGNGSLHKYMVVFSDKKRKSKRENIGKSGDWYVGKRAPRRVRKRLNHLLEEKWN